MDTYALQIRSSLPHSAELKAKVLAGCEEPGASISAVALAHGLNANLVRKWREGRGLKRVGLAAPIAPPVVASTPLIAGDARFVPFGIAAPTEPPRAPRRGGGRGTDP